MVRSCTLVLVAALTLLSAPEVHAGRRHGGHPCRRDAECLSGTCCNGRCSSQSASCDERAGLAAAAGQAKPPAGERCTGKGTWCGACGVCIKGRCTGGDTGRCSACQVCSGDGSACIAVPDGSGVASEYYSCGPDAYGGLWCCGGRCVDTLSSIDNCGACGNACTEGTSCHKMAGGGVGCRCRDWETACNGTCANLQTDPNNCGQCGHVCPSGDCANGVCYCGGSPGGTCGPCETCNKTTNQCEPKTCGAGQICVGGTCQDPCGPCEELVNNVCVPIDTGGVPCCEWQGAGHLCGPGEQCAAWGCCAGGDEVCLTPSGGVQCCNGGLTCQAGRCCIPVPYPDCNGPGCCWWPGY